MPINLLEKRKKHKNDDQDDQGTVDQDAYGIDDTAATTSDNRNYGDSRTTVDNIYSYYTTSDDSNYGNNTTWTGNTPYGNGSDQEITNSVDYNDDGNYDSSEDNNTSATTTTTATADPYGFATTTTEVAETMSTTPLAIEISTTTMLAYPTTTTPVEVAYPTTTTPVEVAYPTTTTPVEVTYPTTTTPVEGAYPMTTATVEIGYTTTAATTSDVIYITNITPATSDVIYTTIITESDSITSITSITSILPTETTTLPEPTSTLIPYSSSFTLSYPTTTSAYIPTTSIALLMSTSTRIWSSTTQDIASYPSSFAPIATASSALDQGKQGDTLPDNDGLSQKSKAIIGGCVGGIGGAIVLGIIAFWWITRRKRQRREIDMESYRPESDYGGLSVNSQPPVSHEHYYDHESSSNFNTSTPNLSADQMIQTRY